MRGTRPPFCVDALVAVKEVADLDVRLRAPLVTKGSALRRMDHGDDSGDAYAAGAVANYVAAPGGTVNYSGDSLSTTVNALNTG